MSASRSLWRYFLGNEKTFSLCEEANGIEFDPISGDWKRLPSYLKQYIITETGVIKSEETTVSYPHTNITEPNYTFRWLIEYPIYLKASPLKIVALQGFSLYKSCTSFRDTLPLRRFETALLTWCGEFEVEVKR